MPYGGNGSANFCGEKKRPKRYSQYPLGHLHGFGGPLIITWSDVFKILPNGGPVNR